MAVCSVAWYVANVIEERCRRLNGDDSLERPLALRCIIIIEDGELSDKCNVGRWNMLSSKPWSEYTSTGCGIERNFGSVFSFRWQSGPGPFNRPSVTLYVDDIRLTAATASSECIPVSCHSVGHRSAARRSRFVCE